ncbi:YvrJ family protein [Sediminibacillus dalangtanensis]|uniref:YvrJ family protein n=1 Tax=Sediminibacillus dalangtanensis TaxID=2729421 RepID=A0ABX7VW97_9BACI|nr:YvrJ family protein [Sediminibacillus dalangtanensis]QTN01130.1 YvrJ family protein [Sediminibacillus dalangtanensis]
MDEISIESMVSLISNLGFPVVLVIYLLVRFEKKISDLSDTIKELNEAIRKRK